MSINCTQHERMLMHARHFVSGLTLRSWLRPSPIFVKKHIRNMDESLVEEAELIECSPSYPHVRLISGRESTISIRDIAPRVENNTELPKKSGETIFIDSDVSFHNVGGHDASIENCVADRGSSINDNVVNESIDENPVGAHVDNCFRKCDSKAFNECS